MEQENSEQIFANNKESQNAEDTKFCTHCGAEILKEAEICIHCGCACEGIRKTEKPKIENLASVLILSVINTVLCCLPLGIISLIFVILAMNADNQEEADNKIKTAKTCNYAGIGIGILFLGLYLALICFGTITSVTGI